jgi:hypothetical protein
MVPSRAAVYLMLPVVTGSFAAGRHGLCYLVGFHLDSQAASMPHFGRVQGRCCLCKRSACHCAALQQQGMQAGASRLFIVSYQHGKAQAG